MKPAPPVIKALPTGEEDTPIARERSVSVL